MQQWILATNNTHKVEELKALLPFAQVLSKAEAGFPDLNPVEDGSTLEENARIKAQALKEALQNNNMWTEDTYVLADDTGLFVEGLDGAPGVHSARFAGEESSDEENRKKLLACLREKTGEARNATFKTVLCLMTVHGTHFIEGTLKGCIAREERGSNGFGYDSVFLLPNGRTLAEISFAEKNKYSHRANAYLNLRKGMQE